MEKTDNKCGLDRRAFLKGAALGIGAMTALGVDVSNALAAGAPEKWGKEADVVIVGLGIAGISAAIEAADNGAQVILLEKGPMASGCTPVSSGTVWLPLNPVQTQADSVEKVVEYMTHCAKAQADENLIKVFAENTKDTADWLVNKMGLEASQPNRYDYHPDYPGAEQGRNFGSKGNGSGLMNLLIKQAKARQVEIITKVQAQRLVVDADGRVIGVMGSKPDQTFKAKKGVILCAGGFSSNEAMKKSFLKVYPFFGQLPGLNGEGILMGMGAGAAIEGMTKGVGVPGFNIPGTDRISRYGAYKAHSFIMVNRKGERFCNETADYDTICTSFYNYDTVADAYTNVPAWLVFDETFRTAGPITRDPSWSKDNSEELGKGWIKKADSLEDLASQIGVDAVALKQTITTYNQYAQAGADPVFHRGEIKGTAGMSPMSGPPYYASEASPGLYDTAGGLKINEKSQVINTYGDVIPGLYAAGTNAHMATGFYYPNGGAALGQPLVFGRIAGKTAAAEKFMA